MSRDEGLSCDVLFYAGYRGRETPRAVRVRGKEIPVERVLERRRLRDVSSGNVAEEFICRLENRTVKLCVADDGCRLMEGTRRERTAARGSSPGNQRRRRRRPRSALA